MTTIVAAARGGCVYMAADSCTNVYDIPLLGARKIIRVPGPGPAGRMLLGVTGDAGMVGLLAEQLWLPLDVPAAPDTDDQADRVAFQVARTATRLAVENHLVDDGRFDGNVLLGWAGRLWTIGHMCAIRHVDGVAALGSGHGYAFGALDALLGAGVDAPDAVLRACRIATDRDRYSGGPLQYEALEGDRVAT